MISQEDLEEVPTDPVIDNKQVISWNIAQKVATKISSRDALSAIEWTNLRRDFDELTPIAESQVAKFTGLKVQGNPARATVVDRGGWIEANAKSFEHLLSPLLDKLPERKSIFGGTFADVFGVVGRAVSGTEVGALLGWMSGKVLGQYDAILAGMRERSGSGSGYGEVMYVGPNILQIERRYGFPPRQFRLWIALHELTHRAQFLGVPWMQDYFFSLVDEIVDASLPEPGQMWDVIQKILRNPKAETNQVISEIGLFGMFMDESQRASFSKVQGLMSLLEGHGDSVMDGAAGELVPLASHFSKILTMRRKKASGVSKLFMTLIGMDAKMRQYSQGEEFVREVHEAGGRQLFDRVWEAPEFLPVAEEIANPKLWIERVG